MSDKEKKMREKFHNTSHNDCKILLINFELNLSHQVLIEVECII